LYLPSSQGDDKGVGQLILTMTGAAGLIGRRLLMEFGAAGYEIRVLSRHSGTNLPAGVKLFVWDPVQGPPPAESLRDAGAVVHLAGELSHSDGALRSNGASATAA